MVAAGCLDGSGVARTLCVDGRIRVAGLARALSPRTQRRARHLRGPAAAQRRVGALVLRRPQHRRGFVRHRRVVAVDRMDSARVRGREERRGLAAGAVFDLGRDGDLAEPHDLETEPVKYFRRGGRGRVPLNVPSELDEPISAEIFSVERLEQHAESLAKAQEVSATQSAGISLRRRLRSNAAGLRAAFHALIEGIAEGHPMTPAAGWLVDNYYIVDEHIRAVRRDLPAGYYKQLPKLSNGPLRGYPRVYGLAWAIVAHSDNCFELDTLVRFCRAYQRVQPLTIGELWAIAITLRVLLIENLSRLAAGIVSRMHQREWADGLADEWLADEPAQAPDDDALRALEGRTLPKTLGVQLFQRLRDRDPEA